MTGMQAQLAFHAFDNLAELPAHTVGGRLAKPTFAESALLLLLLLHEGFHSGEQRLPPLPTLPTGSSHDLLGISEEFEYAFSGITIGNEANGFCGSGNV